MAESKIIVEILKRLPNAMISEAKFEGANIILYTKVRDYFLNGVNDIKAIVDEFKKRIELRPDPSICFDQEKASEIVKSLVPTEAGLKEILYDPSRSLVILEAEKPGLAIGKQGSILNEIKEKTNWVPVIRREPPIRSKIIEGVRKVLYAESEYRKKFLDQVGHRVYDGWIRERKEEWIRVSFLGGARQVGRSCLFLQTPESRILLDCGIDVTSDNEAYPHLEAPEFNINELDAVILSHSHLDHSGLIPYLYKFGYKGPLYCTEPTRDVSALLQLDLVKIMKNEGKEPIYTQDDIKETVKHTITLNYGEVTDVTPDVRITLYNAGHILGSSMVHLHIGNGFHNIVYSGDIKYAKSKLFDAAETNFPRLETLFVESTYGGKSNVLPSKTESDDELAGEITKAIDKGGKVLIPVLGSGRAQEVMAIIHSKINEGKIPPITVYVDGIVWDITAIHCAYPEFMNRDMNRQMFQNEDNPFLSEHLKRVGSQKEREGVINDEGSCVILATSGMLVGGPSVEYLKKLCENPKNTLIFVAYQGEGSLGRRIQRGEREIHFSVNGKNVESYQMKMNVHTIEGLSGHSDRRQLMAFVKNLKPKPKRIIINHGEASREMDLASSYHQMFNVETVAPRNLDTLRIK